MARPSTYQPLAPYLAAQPPGVVELMVIFAEIEAIIGELDARCCRAVDDTVLA
jgi:hypothetical protein